MGVLYWMTRVLAALTRRTGAGINRVGGLAQKDLHRGVICAVALLRQPGRENRPVTDLALVLPVTD